MSLGGANGLAGQDAATAARPRVRVVNVIGGLAARQGGPAVALADSTRALAGLVVARTIYATDNEGPAGTPYVRISPQDFPGGPEGLDVRLFRLRRPRRVLFSPQLHRALRRDVSHFDVVHVHGMYLFPHFAGWRAARAGSRPHVVSLHGVLDPYLRDRGKGRKRLMDVLWQKRLLEEAAAIHVATEDERRLTADIAPEVPRYVIPQGIRYQDFQDLKGGREFRERRLGGHDGPVVLFMGRVSFKKGLDRLIRAVAVVARDHDVRLAIVGPDDEGLRPSLESLAEDLGIARRVTFTGPIYGEDRGSALDAADVWTLPSHSENFGIAVVEALAAGLPTVVSDRVNVGTDLAREGAVLVTSTDPADIADKIGEVLSDTKLRQALASAGRSAARSYDWGIVARRFEQMYANVAAE